MGVRQVYLNAYMLAYWEIFAAVVDRCERLASVRCDRVRVSWRRIQLNLNSFGSILFSFSPNANEGLSRYGLVTFASLGVGRAFSSTAGSVFTVGRLEEKGIRKGGMVGN